MQDQDSRHVSPRGRNIAVIAVIAAIAAALFLFSRLGPAGSRGAGLPLPSPAPAASSAIAPEASPAPRQRGETASPAPDQGASDSARDGQAYLLISVKGRLYGIEPLDGDRDVEITQETGETNVIHITRGGFHMASSTCDNQLCISQGEVTTENYSWRILGPYVLCLPNQVELQLVVLNATAPPDMPDI